MANINFLAVFVSAIVSMIIGFLWYGPIFGKKWMALSGITGEQMSSSKSKGVGKSYALGFLGSLVMSYVLANAIIFASSYLKTSGVSAGLMSGFFNWLGFVAPVLLGSVLWEKKSWSLWILNNSYYLVSMLAMGVILSLWH